MAQAQAQAQAQADPVSATRAKLLAALAAGSGTVTINTAKLAAGTPYTVRQLAKLVGYQPPVRNGKPRYGKLRRQLAKLVAAGKLVTVTTGGYVTANGNTAGGTAYYMVVGE